MSTNPPSPPPAQGNIIPIGTARTQKAKKTATDKPPNLAKYIYPRVRTNRPGWSYVRENYTGKGRKSYKQGYKGYLHSDEWNKIKSETTNEKAQVSEIIFILKRKKVATAMARHYGRKLQSGEPGAVEAVLTWLDESGDELQADLDSVHFCHPQLVAEFDVADLKARIKMHADQPEALAAIGIELIALDEAINSTRQDLDEILPNDLFLGDTTDEEIEKHIRKHFNLRCGEVGD